MYYDDETSPFQPKTFVLPDLIKNYVSQFYKFYVSKAAPSHLHA